MVSCIGLQACQSAEFYCELANICTINCDLPGSLTCMIYIYIYIYIPYNVYKIIEIISIFGKPLKHKQR